MAGNIVAVCIGEAKGSRKRPVPKALVQADHGLAGDAHAGDCHRQVSLLASESIQKMRDLGLSVTAGDFAENLTTIGIDLIALPVGSHLNVGEAVLEITQIGKECHTRCAIFYQAGDCVMPKEGVFARVIRGGTVSPGDRIEHVEALTAKGCSKGPRGKYNVHHKNCVISMRLSDDEMAGIQQLMRATNKRASELMREAYQLFKQQMESGDNMATAN
jgi:MOSC domain-containing protein YiiM